MAWRSERVVVPYTIRRTILIALCAISSAMRAGERKSGPVALNTKPGSILCEYFQGIPGGGVEDLVRSPAFPNNPSESIALLSFEIPENTGENYGTAVRGFIYPPATGNYTFWIASDDGSELWLSPTENPKDKVKICQMSAWCAARAWDTAPEQKSKPIPLSAGRRYYIEALHKQGSGGDNLAVGWQLPDAKMERPIPGTRLAPAGIAKPPPPVTVAIQGQLPTKPGFFKCASKVTGGGAPFDFPFLLFVPNDFGKAPSPSLLFLHGVGECGTDLEGVYGNGPHGHLRGDKALRDKMPFLIIGPQCAPGRSWNQRQITRATVALLDEILKAYGNYLDKDRVCMTGLSMGGQGTWCVALEAPDRFAAIVPSDPRAVTPEVATERLKDLPTWIIAGAEDGDFTKGAKEMFEALKGNVPKPQLMLVPNCGHGAWGYYYPKWQFYEWLLKWRRSPARIAQSAAVASNEKKSAQDLAKEAAAAEKAAQEAAAAEKKAAEAAAAEKKAAEAVAAKEAAAKELAAKEQAARDQAAKELAAKKEVAAKSLERNTPAKKAETPVVATPDSFDEVLKRIAAGKAAQAEKPIEPAKPVESPKVLPAVASPPVAAKKNEVIVKIEPKPALPAKIEGPALVANTVPPPELSPKADEPAVETHAPVRFPYAPVFLLGSALFFMIAMYFLTIEE